MQRDWEKFGMKNEDIDTTLTIPIKVTVEGLRYSSDVSIRYRAKKDKRGMAKLE